MWFPPKMQDAIEERYGSKQGMLKHFWFGVLYRCGAYRRNRLSAINYRPKRLVFVCAGNICRSPLAEAVAAQLGMEVCSFGLDTRGNDKADARALAFAESYGIDCSEHRTTPIAEFVAEEGDLLVAMEPYHLKLLRQSGVQVPTVLLGLTDNDFACPYIHDPFNTRLSFFKKTEQLVVDRTKALVAYVKK
ncbi:low molecular weight phosphatase family protein [Reinekea blandensis]|uniref:protein-tyrosine-phosphatase n=1 Tax=Reinekea blandensis MED297 TaxID=314283 RepID=A4B947_9GAMM|nr:low molecular weight phosphatase family protein [Reinekea blandensis]EAR11148.1 Protein-tyrosine-phosphatase [Reinekea sp. MED297] [Reinekea blandensis MED297]